jgi:hypothetical protein
MSARNESRTKPAVRTDRQARAYELSLAGNSSRKISDLMRAEGYTQIGHTTVDNLLKAEHARIVVPLATEHVKRQYERLEAQRLHLAKLQEHAQTILDRFHITVNNGQVIYHGNEPVRDDGPELAAIGTMVNIEKLKIANEQRLAKLFGLDAPTQVHTTVVQTTETDAAISALITEMDAADDAPAVVQTTT